MNAASKVVGGVVLALCVVAMAGFALYPSAVAGVSGRALGASVSQEAGVDSSQAINWIACWPGDHVEWRCSGYHVDSDWRGCWEAERITDQQTLSGCISFRDFVGLNGPPLDPT